MQRWKLTIEYDGTKFVGWQRQNVEPSVQSVLENAAFKLCGEKTILHVAGRTDSGVHALGQVAHVDFKKKYQAHAIRNALNVHSRPHAVSVLKAEPMPQEFHARFKAMRRHYRYVICNRPSIPAVGKQYMWHIGRKLDLESMRKAANLLIGTHDFSSFRAAPCQAKSPIKSIERIEIIEQGELVLIEVSAPSFLHHMVRNIVGTLRKVGDGSWPWQSMKDILEAKSRDAGGPTAPPDGLFFVSVDYPEIFNK